MSRLNVLFVTTWYPTPEAPVRGTFIREHAKAVGLRHNVVLMHLDRMYVHGMRRPYLAHETVDEGVRVLHVRYGRFPLPKARRFNFGATAVLAARRLARDGFRPDVVHANIYLSGVPAVWIGRWFRAPVVLSENFTRVSKRELAPKQAREARYVFSRLDRGLPVCGILGEAMVDYGLRPPYTVVPNTVDTGVFYRDGNAPHDPVPRFLAVNLLTPIKGIPHLLAAATALRDRGRKFGLDIVGDGPELENYRALAESLGLGGLVVFHGRRNKTEIASMMRRAHAFVLASLWENLPNVIIEALLCGLPVVATSVSGNPELVDEDNGLLVSPADEEALAAAMERMLDSPEAYSRSGIAERAARRYSFDAVSAQLDGVYREVLAERDRA